MLRLLPILLLFLTGCLYRAGSGLTAGVMDELAAKGQSGGVEEVGDRLLDERRPQPRPDAPPTDDRSDDYTRRS